MSWINPIWPEPWGTIILAATLLALVWLAMKFPQKGG